MEVRSVEAIIRALNDAAVEYLVVGGLAVNAHGYERLTYDVDLVIGLNPANIMRGLRALEGIDYHMAIPVQPEEFADEAVREKWRHEKGMVVLKLWSDAHRRTPVDVFIFEPFDFPQEYLAAQWVEITPEIKASILQYDSLLAMKKEAAREKDLADIRELKKLDPYRSKMK